MARARRRLVTQERDPAAAVREFAHRAASVTVADMARGEHVHLPFGEADIDLPAVLGTIVARRLGVPCVVSIQGGDGHWVGSCCATHLDAMRIVCEQASALLIGCASFRDEVVERLGVAPELFTVVPGAVDVERFAPQASGGSPPRDEADRPHPRPQSPSVCSITPRGPPEGILDLLDALPESQELAVSGIGPDYEPACAAAAGRPVRFLGQIDYADVPAVYAEGDVFVSPTYAEGFSNTVLEAMAAGLPIVSTTAVGVVDCLRHEENALLVEPGDVAGLRAALERITSDAALRDRLRAAALEEVRATYAWPRVAALIDAEYAGVAGTTPADGWEIPAPCFPAASATRRTCCEPPRRRRIAAPRRRSLLRGRDPRRACRPRV